jgi:hypothetical protein
VVNVPVIYRLAFDDGVDTVRAIEEVRATIVAISQFLRANQTLERSAVFQAPRLVPGVRVANDAVVAPAGDVVPTEVTEIIRIRPQDVTFV